MLYIVLLLIVLFLPMLNAKAVAAGDVSVSLRDYSGTNIPSIEKYLQGNALLFDTSDPAPAGAAYFSVRYQFNVTQDGWYSLALTLGRGPGAAGQSRFSWVVDDGAAQPALRAQRVFAEAPGGNPQHLQPPLRLAAGKHTLELRFSPDQRMRVMSRATEAFDKHHVELFGIGWQPVTPPAPVEHHPLSAHCRLRSHDKIVLFGDSITEEGFYGRHFARIVARVFPDSGITIYNSGVSLNRTPEGVARLDDDVLALHPDWAVLAFGVNDSMQLAPEDYARNCTNMVQRLREKGVNVLCASPSGMTPNVEGLGASFFSMHATDRATAIDRTMLHNVQALREVARRQQVLFADIYGAITRSAFPRIALMNNQWHPNEEGGRMIAVTLLRTLGMSEEEIARTGDARDLGCFRALDALTPEPALPRLEQRLPDAPLHGTVIFAAAYGDNRLLACAAKGDVLAVLPTAHHPAALACATRRKELYVACEGAGRILIYTLPALRPAGEIDLGLEGYPTGLVLSADESTLWVASFFGGKVLEIDPATRRVRRELPVSDVVNGIALSADEKTLFVSQPGKLALLNTARGEVTATIETVKFTAACLRAPDGGMALLDAEHWLLYPLEQESHKLAAPIAAPYQTRALAYQQATGHLFAGDWLNSRLLEMDGTRILHASPLPCPVMALCVADIQ